MSSVTYRFKAGECAAQYELIGVLPGVNVGELLISSMSLDYIRNVLAHRPSVGNDQWTEFDRWIVVHKGTERPIEAVSTPETDWFALNDFHEWRFDWVERYDLEHETEEKLRELYGDELDAIRSRHGGPKKQTPEKMHRKDPRKRRGK